MNIIGVQINVIEDSDCDESGEVLPSRRQQLSMGTDVTLPAANNDVDANELTQDFLAAVEMEFSSASARCSVVSVKKASSCCRFGAVQTPDTVHKLCKKLSDLL